MKPPTPSDDIEDSVCRICKKVMESGGISTIVCDSHLYCNNCLLLANECKHKTRALSAYTPEEIDKIRREKGPSVHAEDPFEDYVQSLDGLRRDKWLPIVVDNPSENL